MTNKELIDNINIILELCGKTRNGVYDGDVLISSEYETSQKLKVFEVYCPMHCPSCSTIETLLWVKERLEIK